MIDNSARRSSSKIQISNAPEPAAEAPVRSMQTFEGVRSTGFFQTPPDEGIPTNLSVFLSSFDTETRRATVRVNRLVNGTAEQIFSRTLDVPSGEGRRLDVDDVAGQTIEIRVESGDEIIPSAVIAHYFVADGGIVVQLYRSPTDFVRV